MGHTIAPFRVGHESMCVGELMLSSDCQPIYDADRIMIGITFEKEDARHIVAAVNACAGIPIEMLEAMPSGPAALLPMYARLEKQRDELLSALEKLQRRLSACAECGEGANESSIRSWLDIANIAISSAKDSA